MKSTNLKRAAIYTLILVIAGLVGSCHPLLKQPQRRGSDRGGAQNPSSTRSASGQDIDPERTLIAVVQPDGINETVVPDADLYFTDLRGAFIALRDSAISGSVAERYELLITPGLYRVRKTMTWVVDDKETKWRELLIRPTGRGEVIISGAELYCEGEESQPWNDLDRWNVQNEPLHRYSISWPYDFGKIDTTEFDANYRKWISGCERPEMLMRREMVLVNGVRLQQRLQDEKLIPSSFKVRDGENGRPGRLYIQLDRSLSASDEIQIPIVEKLLILRGLDRVHIERIDFIHANPHHGTKAVTISGTQSVQLKNCGFNDHNWKGLGIGNPPLPINRARPDTIELINCRANGNGGMGWGLGKLARVRIENCELSYNSWRSWEAGTDAWAVGGSKIFHGHDVTITGLHAHHNLATGQWFDSDGEHIRIVDSVFEYNERDGLFLEASQGPIDVIGCTFAHNGRDGLRSNSSNFITVRDCRFEMNQAANFCIAGMNRKFKNFETGAQLHVTGTNNLFRNNQFLGEPIWHAEEWLTQKKQNQWVENTTFINNACWPYDPDNAFCQKVLPENKR